MKIALLDVDGHQAHSLCDMIGHMGHECTAFDPDTDLLQHVEHEPFHVFVVALHHGQDGAHIVQAVRKSLPATVPILCITGSTNEDGILAMQDAGANDYLLTPIRRKDLVVRLMVLYRRAHPLEAGAHRFQIGPYIFQLRNGRASIHGKRVDLTRKEFDLALLFLRHLGQPLSRTLILETIWGGKLPEMSRTMDTHVSRVRSKLGLVPQNGFRLSPVYGYGYRLDQTTSIGHGGMQSIG